MFGFKSLIRFLAVWLGVIAILSISSAPVFAAEKPEIFVQLGHTSSINVIAISPDNKFILSGSDDNSIKLWEAATGRLIRTFKDNEDINFVSFLPGGKSFFHSTIKVMSVSGISRPAIKSRNFLWEKRVKPACDPPFPMTALRYG